MTPTLEQRLLKVSKKIEQLYRVRAIAERRTGSDPRSLISDAAIVAAELVAAVTGNQDEDGAVYRAYEEVFAALENSNAIQEMLAEVNIADEKFFERKTRVAQVIRTTRSKLMEP